MHRTDQQIKKKKERKVFVIKSNVICYLIFEVIDNNGINIIYSTIIIIQPQCFNWFLTGSLHFG